MDVRKGGKIKS